MDKPGRTAWAEIQEILRRTEADVRAVIESMSDTSDALVVTKIGAGEAFHFYWPAGEETYEQTTRWQVAAKGRTSSLLIGRTKRPAWGRGDRGRVVVFGPARPGSHSLHPWIEFTETDTGKMSSVVPDPSRPRRVLRDGAPLPRYLQDRDVQRADHLFKSIRNGASLRLAVDPDDEEGMVEHAYHVALLKGRA